MFSKSLFLTFLCAFFSNAAIASLGKNFVKQMSGSIAIIPFYSDSNSSPYKNFFKQLATNSREIDLSVNYYPYKRSITMLVAGESDFHFPVAYSDNVLPAGLKFSSFSTYSAEFGIFYRKNLGVEMSEEILLLPNSGLKVEAIAPHRSMYFKQFKNIKIAPCGGCGLKKVDSGRIDGFIYEKYAGLKALHQAGIKNLKYKRLKEFPVHFLLRDDDEFEAIDNLLKNLFYVALNSGSVHHMFRRSPDYLFKLQGSNRNYHLNR
jgi:hypothetical protein